AILFPHAEGLADGELAAETRCENALASARFTTRGADGVVGLKLGAARTLPPQRPIDIAFVLDTPGPTAGEIAAVKTTIQRVPAALSSENVRVRIGMVEYKDRTDPFVTKVYPMTTDLGRFSTQIAGVSAGGGGDMPESVNEGIHVALTKLDWSDLAI